jgi:hypothetical protein
MKPKPQYVFRRVNQDPIPHDFILWMKTRLTSKMEPEYLAALLQSAQANDEGYRADMAIRRPKKVKKP